MPKLRTLIAAPALALAATLLVGVAPASAAGNSKCDTNSPQWNVDICVRTNASQQTDGTGYRMDNVRVWAKGDVATLEDCSAFVATVILYRGNGEAIDTRAGNACKFTDYSTTFDFGNVKFPANGYVKVRAQMYDNGDPDPGPAYITMDAIG